MHELRQRHCPISAPTHCQRRTAKKRVATARLAHQARQETPIAEIFLRDMLGVSRDFRLWHSQRNSEAVSVGGLRLGFCDELPAASVHRPIRVLTTSISPKSARASIDYVGGEF